MLQKTLCIHRYMGVCVDVEVLVRPQPVIEVKYMFQPLDTKVTNLCAKLFF